METQGANVDFVLGKTLPEPKDAPLFDLEQFNIEDLNDEDYHNLPDNDLTEELLYCVQEVGALKEVEGKSVYVKGADCEASLKDIHRFIRRDSRCTVRLALGKWEFLQKELLPLLLSQTKDKRLSFLILILLVDLTELPDPNDRERDCRTKDQVLSCLQSYKHAFLSSAVLSVLMVHVAECLQKEGEARTERHNQMIELILILLKHLLKISEPLQTIRAGNELHRDLQKRLIIAFKEANVLDSFVYLTQDMTSPISKKLGLDFLDIFYTIFKQCRAKVLVETCLLYTSDAADE
eukprot:TRINITY_DN4080_c0_g1_i1.p1 TRINITY_DN4080_c0_g1~~TRINITY_DN4080_c0_g1_i1.p1  ORF type:complete len:337 (-),score=102.82 TRINITY_DN4080_c0_g1_i1:47-925(-)